MFARNVTFRMKSNMHSDYTRTFENEILPLLRKQKGFREEFTLSNPNSQDAVAISLWENKANADAYNTNAYPEVLKTLARMIDGTPKVQTFEAVTSTLHAPVAV
jgi:quinol monooxygenase YgiN